jgi:peptidoglycan/xylan/chitin deacetylase (PgdA/CDA1 family)
MVIAPDCEPACSRRGVPPATSSGRRSTRARRRHLAVVVVLLGLFGLLGLSVAGWPGPAVAATGAEATSTAGGVSCPTPLTGVIREHRGRAHNVAFTFDDGPHPVDTPAMLDVLARHVVRGTFFVVGQRAEQYPQLMRRIIDEGHLVANHTWTHPTEPNHLDVLPVAERERQMDRTTAIVQQTTAATPCFFRGPQGHHNSDTTIRLANDRRMTVTHWTVSSRDAFQPQTYDEAVVAELVRRTTEPLHARPILLWHDGGSATSRKPNSAPAVDRAIAIYKRNGYGFVDPAGRAIPPVSADLLSVCPAAQRLAPGFRDVPMGSVHRHAIMCAATRGVVTGRADGTFAPTRSVTRGQVAAMLVRHVTDTGAALPAGAPVTFPDVAGTTHQRAIERLASAGIIRGRSDGTFGPNDPVRRDQLASLLDGTARRIHGLEASLGKRFPDVAAGSTHEAAIRRMASLGVVTGTTQGRFEPAKPVSRAQVAAMLMRLTARV